MEKENLELKEHRAEIKAGPHITINTALFSALIVFFTLIVTINPQILKEDTILSLQLCISIILLLYSSISRARIAIYYDSKINKFGTFLYANGLGCFINVIGILIFDVVSMKASLTYFISALLILGYYSYLVIRHYKDNYNAWRYKKDALTLVIILVLGLFKVLGFYN